MEPKLSKPALRTRQEAREWFRQTGKTITEWSMKNGYSPVLVSRILNTDQPCERGQSHEIAVKLGIKAGFIVGDDEI